MTSQTQDNQAQTPTEAKVSDKELNFRALEQKYKAQLEQERQARFEAERIAQEAQQRKVSDEDDDDSEPYVDKRKLNKTLNKFGQSTQSDIQRAMEQAKLSAKEELKQEMWLEQNPDFYDTLQKHAETLAQHSPDLAKTILKMPEGFERQKLVYQNIKTLKLDKPPEKQSSIQDKIDANRRSPYYQPSGMGSAPYGAGVGGKEYSQIEQKNAYEQVMALKNRLRL